MKIIREIREYLEDARLRAEEQRDSGPPGLAFGTALGAIDNAVDWLKDLERARVREEVTA